MRIVLKYSYSRETTLLSSLLSCFNILVLSSVVVTFNYTKFSCTNASLTKGAHKS